MNELIRYRVPARVGLLGNPSDGFGGKTISAMVEPYAACVSIWESREITLQPNPIHDPIVFPNLAGLHECATSNGYYGGLRLMWATCKRFFDYCRETNIDLPNRNFTMRYDTSIPRQVGLAGSSAIVTGALKCLIDFYEIREHQLPLPVQPNLVLQAETEELGIAAGLQDRVVQVYGGLVYMDFNPALISAQGYGRYETMDIDLLPPLYVAFTRRPSDSSRIHSPMRERFRRGEPEVVQAMAQFAEFAERGRIALLERDYVTLAKLMNANFDLRRRVYGDQALGAQNLEMVQTARDLGLPAKLAGSGGGIVGFYEDDLQFRRLRAAMADRGYSCFRAEPTLAPEPERSSWIAAVDEAIVSGASHRGTPPTSFMEARSTAGSS